MNQPAGKVKVNLSAVPVVKARARPRPKTQPGIRLAPMLIRVLQIVGLSRTTIGARAYFARWSLARITILEVWSENVSNRCALTTKMTRRSTLLTFELVSSKLIKIEQLRPRESWTRITNTTICRARDVSIS